MDLSANQVISQRADCHPGGLAIDPAQQMDLVRAHVIDDRQALAPSPLTLSEIIVDVKRPGMPSARAQCFT